MIESEFIKWSVLAIFGVAGWLLRKMIDDNSQKVAKLEGEVNLIKSNYLHKDDFKEFKLELKSMFEEIRKDLRAISGRE